MCGIAGILSFSPKHRVTRETLAKMSQCIAHRGPDGEGLWLNHDGEPAPDRPQVGLVHRRLAILDPDPRSNQPFTDGRGRWIVFNGEIYNFRELRTQLEQLLPDYAWRTNGDTEVLLASYAAWGEQCVEHLNGMFAFAVWDENAKSLFLARDRMGQKPLYVAFPPNFSAFAFGSELAALRGTVFTREILNPAALADYLRLGYLPGAVSMRLGFLQLTPGRTMTIRQPAMPDGRRYFDANLRHASIRRDVGSARAAILRAVERQLVSDVPIGCFLSGGMDSSIVAAAMKAVVSGGQPVHTFSIGFADPRYDETPHAREVAKHLDTVHHEFVITPDVLADLPTLAATFGDPFADSSALPTHYLARETRQHVKVALSGDGGDELFGGYERYRAIDIAERWPHSLGPLTRVGERLSRGHPKSKITRAGRFIASLALPPGRRFESYLRLFDETSLRLLLVEPPKDDASAWPIAEKFDRFHADGAEPVQAALAVDRVTYLPDDLLTKVDRASMLHALEVRAPFMDHELVQFAAGLTTDQLLKGGGKRMLREAFAADLPAWVFKRKKMGFAVPIGDWFRGPLRAMLHDHLFAADSFASGYFNLPFVRQMVEQHEAKIVDHSQRLYALLMLELWWKQQRV